MGQVVAPRVLIAVAFEETGILQHFVVKIVWQHNCNGDWNMVLLEEVLCVVLEIVWHYCNGD